jgi:hypothetical protein
MAGDDYRFWTLLGQLKTHLAETWGKDDTNYRRLFWNNLPFTKRLYSLLGVSGAAVAIADPLTHRAVLMQSQDEDADRRDFLTIDMPFLAETRAANRFFAPNADPRQIEHEFSTAIHSLFVKCRQRQRLNYDPSAGLTTGDKEGGDVGTLEFLRDLPRGFEPPPDKDCIHCPVGEVSWCVALWRWILYVGSRHELTKEISDIQFEDVWDARSRLGCGQYYGDLTFFGSQLVDYAEGLPEAWMLHDRIAPGETSPAQRARQTCDAISQTNMFAADCHRLGICSPDGKLTSIGRTAWLFYTQKACNRFGQTEGPRKLRAPKNIREFAKGIHNFCIRQNQQRPVIHLFTWLHSRAQFPVIPYFYLTVIDGSPKEHLVFPVLRSNAFPIDLCQGLDSIQKTTCVAVALFSLNCIQRENENKRIQRLLALEIVLRIVAERVLDQAFYGRIQSEYLRRKGEADSLHQLLKDFKAFSNRAETFHTQWQVYTRAHPGPVPEFRPRDDLSASLMLLAAGAEGRLFEMPEDCAACLREEGISAETLESRLIDRVVWPQALSRVLCQPDIFDKIQLPGVRFPTEEDVERHFPKPHVVVEPRFSVQNPWGLYPYILIALRSAYEHAYRWTLLSPPHSRAKVIIKYVGSPPGNSLLKILEQITVSNNGIPPSGSHAMQIGWLRDLASLDRLKLPWAIRPDSERRASVYDPAIGLWRTQVVRLQKVEGNP